MLKSNKAIHMKYIDKRLSFLFYEYVFKKELKIKTYNLKLLSKAGITKNRFSKNLGLG